MDTGRICANGTAFSLQEAKTEAKRLALKHKGRTFWVLKAVNGCMADDVTWEGNDDGLD
jgi:hypothetical protein